MVFEMQVEGFSALEEELDALSKAAGKGVLRRALKASAEPMARLMRLAAPRGDGDLVESIAVSDKLSPHQRAQHRRMFRDDRAAVEMFVGAGPLPQAHNTEFGNEHQTPQPWARPAWDRDHQAMLKRLGEDLWAELSKAIARAERRAARRM